MSQREAAPPPSPPPAVAAQPPAAPVASSLCLDHGAVQDVGREDLTYAAVARRPIDARRAPSGRTIASFGARNDNGHPMVFEIRGMVDDGCGRTWYDASLPARPNGVTGFVSARDVNVYVVHSRIVVDLSERKLVFFKWGKKALEETVAVGARDTPTPTGRYYVNQRLIASDPSGPWGPGAIGISAFSDVLQEWSQGGPIAIHGTDNPASIGRAVSHGCVRLPNAALRRLFAATPAGTPVIIHP
jgi:lipoprotein-anchoring transpeptidase ErfK/SrfK